MEIYILMINIHKMWMTILWFSLFIVSIMYNIGSSDSKEECKTNHSELIETQVECLLKYPAIGSSTDPSTGSSTDPSNKAECKTNHPELIETREECLSAFESDLMLLPVCSGDLRLNNCTGGSDPATCEVGYSPIAQEMGRGNTGDNPSTNIAFKCKWNTSAERGGGSDNCDPWNKISIDGTHHIVDPENPIELCRIV